MHWFVRKLKEKRWMKKKRKLDKKNYIEKLLRELMPKLFSYAKELGLSFEVHPESFKYTETKCQWSLNHLEKRIKVPIDTRTLRVIPLDPALRRRALGHEIGHFRRKMIYFPACFKRPDFIEESNLHEGLQCLFVELEAEARACSVLKTVYLAKDNIAVHSEGNKQERYINWIKCTLRHQCVPCLQEIKRGRCSKAKEIYSLSQSLGIKKVLGIDAEISDNSVSKKNQAKSETIGRGSEKPRTPSLPKIMGA